jgi:hypothetical protein
MSQNIASPPSHILRLEVPLDFKANPAAEESDIEGAMRQAMAAILPMLRVGTLGLLCGQIDVTLEEAQ